jgi:von Willebrand factor type D domain
MAIAILLIGGIVTVVLVNRHSATPAAGVTRSRPVTTAGGITSEDQLLTAIRTQGLTPTRAEELFVLDVGPLPGVSVSGVASNKWFDGTGGVLALQSEWASLPKAVQNAALQLITSSRKISGPGTAPGSASRTVQLTSRTIPDVPAPRVSADRYVLTAYTQADYLQLAQIANAEESAKLGVPAISAFSIEVSNNGSQEYASTSFYSLQYIPQVQWVPNPDGCAITVFDPKMQGLGSEDVAAIMSHEVFHCFQQRQAGSNKNAASVSAWVGEGQATWVMEQLHPTNTVAAKCWSKYVFTPETKYDDRSYDGVGVFGHEGDLLGDQEKIWPLLLAVVTADVGGQDSAALHVLMSSDSSRFYSTWGGSYYEDASQGDWRMAGPGMPPTSGPTPRSVTIGNGDAQEIGLFGPYQAAQTVIDGSADILVVNLTSGYGKAHDSDYTVDKTLDSSAPLALCLKQGGCKCPDGSPGASEHTIPATSPITVGLDGGDASLAAYASGDSLDKFCKQPDNNPPPTGPPPPGGGGGGGGGGGEPDTPQPPGGVSEGDPHLLTFDGKLYDLQAAGEFTMVRSASGDFVIQVRAVPLAGSQSVAANAAIATKVDGHRVTVSIENATIVARVDGVVVDHEEQAVASGTLQRLGTEAGVGYVIEWSDGTAVRVGQFGRFGINATVTPSAARRGQLVGLLGNDNGNQADDLAYANGTALGTSITPQILDGAFADSWRIVQATSLFDYRPGQSTATFTDRTFPSRHIDASTAPNAATVKARCQAEGITDTYLLQDCIIDASATHSDQAVLSHYAQAQTVMTVQTALAHNLPPFPVSSSGGGPGPAQTGTPAPVTGALNTLVDAGTIADSHETKSFTFPASAGDVIFTGFPGCDDGGMVFTLIDPNGKTLNPDDVQFGLRICLHGRFAIAVTGTYTLVANADMKGRGSYGVPIRFDRHDQTFQTSYGQAASGNIPDQATRDIYTFTATTGDIVHLYGDGCAIGPANSLASLSKSDGTPVIALDCSQGSIYQFQTTGSFELIVNFEPVGPYPYHFVLQKGQ